MKNALAKIAKEDPSAATAVAAFGDLKKEIEKPENASYKLQFEVHSLELQGTFALKKGDAIKGLMLLSEAAPKELTLRAEYDDPPFFPTLMYSKLGYAYLAESSPKLAADAFERGLETVKNDPFALAGLARARQALGDTTAASRALGRAMSVWSDAEPGLRWLDEAKAAGIRATPIDVSPGPQRSYRTKGLDKFGPAIWQPFAAPALDARDSTGTRVSLDQFKGRNVVLVFYLGAGCAHCVSQIKDLSERSDKWKGLDADVVAVSSDTVASNAASQSSLKVRLLTDDQFKNARLFKSFDDFEEMPIHSTVLIDKSGRVHWARHGGGPFTDYDFLAARLERMNAPAAKVSSSPSSARRQ